MGRKTIFIRRMGVLVRAIAQFVRAFWEHVERERITVPIGLHLDHTQGFEVIQEAIAQASHP
jgi:fructose/tagatose bisphosphate aldolase